ncbi:diguanylate cyclase [Clostridium sp. OS1-26]|uniref:diguanylate cyclase n=1 Tax=Clostridium sp. OS1-26 TaxID=3070681 RepID=UPI0027DEBBD9|nr:diguanylate cyclase [Clostridium sp. OS1-26]WML32965.1 diguanylate cyclase [Clostridium sp. OS1-26]
MVVDLFINACILITFISVSHNFVINRNISKNPSISLKILIGACCSSLGILLMLFGVHITSTIVMDFRTVPIMLAAIFGGIIPPIITVIMMCFFRTLYFGISTAAVVSIVATMFSGIGFGVISIIKKTRREKWIYSVIYSNLVSTISYIILIKDRMFLLKLLLLYYIGISFVSYFVYRYTEYLCELVEFYNRLRNEATTDFLTGLNNVRQFDKIFNNVSKQTIKDGKNLSLLYLDIDYFKKINDTYGHIAGDTILKNLADILRNACREIDIISRNGGEEFTVLLLDCSASNAVRIAERIRKDVEANKFYVSDKISIYVTVSIGVSMYPDKTNNIDMLLENADLALYEAKKTGRNKVMVYGGK